METKTVKLYSLDYSNVKTYLTLIPQHYYKLNFLST